MLRDHAAAVVVCTATGALRCSTARGSLLPLGRGPLLSNLGSAAALLLPLSGQPAAHQLEAGGILAIPLVPAPRVKDPLAPLAQTLPRSECRTASRRRGGNVMLILSQGRLAPAGAAREALISRSGTFFVGLPTGPLDRGVYLGPATLATATQTPSL